MPAWVGRLPSDVGYPAAGSLSADEYKALALVYMPVIVLDFCFLAHSSCPMIHSRLVATFRLGGMATRRCCRV